MPSRPSAVAAMRAMASVSNSICVSSVSTRPLWNSRRISPKASVGPAAISSAVAVASASSSASGTTRVTMPYSCACAALNIGLVSVSSSARGSPTLRGRKYVEEPSGVRPALV